MPCPSLLTTDTWSNPKACVIDDPGALGICGLQVVFNVSKPYFRGGLGA
jgi:hypothetical protein